jgi:D-alanyl-D-alanine-carboxypeptidase/D-alanyl-D-alanine-endopeptidase
MVMLIVRGQQVYFQGYGETAPHNGQAPNADSFLRLCSLSKTFSADMLVKLAIAKTVRLDDPLALYAPAHKLVPSRDGRVITLRDLATHTAGLPREQPSPGGVPHFTFPNFAQRWAWLPRLRLRSAPGTVAFYSNVGFDLLGDALAAAANQPYPQLLAERTLRPLGMNESTFDPTPAQCARLLIASRDEGPCTSTVATAASSGLYSTARDVVQWLKYLLGTSAPALPAQPGAAEFAYLRPAQLLRTQGLDHAGIATGLGLGWIHTQPLDTEGEIIEKTGGGAGYLTYIALNQPHHTGIFIAATDGYRPRGNLFKAANEILLAMAGLPPLPPEPVAPVRHPASHRAAARLTRAPVTSKRTAHRKR